MNSFIDKHRTIRIQCLLPSFANISRSFLSTLTPQSDFNNIFVSNVEENKLEQFRSILGSRSALGSYAAFKKLSSINYRGVTADDLNKVLSAVWKGTAFGPEEKQLFLSGKAARHILSVYDEKKVLPDRLYFDVGIILASKSGNANELERLIVESKLVNGIDIKPEILIRNRIRCAIVGRNLQLADELFEEFRKLNPDSEDPFVDYMWMRGEDQGVEFFEKWLEIALKLRDQSPSFKITAALFTPLMSKLNETHQYSKSRKLMQKMKYLNIPATKRIQPYILRAVMENDGYEVAKGYFRQYVTAKENNYYCLELGMEIAANSRMKIAEIMRMFKRSQYSTIKPSQALLRHFPSALMKCYNVNSTFQLIENVMRFDVLKSLTHNDILVGLMKSFALRGDLYSLDMIYEILLKRGYRIESQLRYWLIRAPLLDSTFLTSLYRTIDEMPMWPLPGYKSALALHGIESSSGLYERFSGEMKVDDNSQILGELILFSYALGFNNQAEKFIKICEDEKILIREKILRNLRILLNPDDVVDLGAVEMITAFESRRDK
ncbi:hypothetical protein HK098_003895 [Nowakowskiella sp. JEL0407]|nr:hypothetical protein HK098_003895 [Nowakowskiella sp. JEL0407]